MIIMSGYGFNGGYGSPYGGGYGGGFGGGFGGAEYGGGGYGRGYGGNDFPRGGRGGRGHHNSRGGHSAGPPVDRDCWVCGLRHSTVVNHLFQCKRCFTLHAPAAGCSTTGGQGALPSGYSFCTGGPQDRGQSVGSGLGQNRAPGQLGPSVGSAVAQRAATSAVKAKLEKPAPAKSDVKSASKTGVQAPVESNRKKRSREWNEKMMQNKKQRQEEKKAQAPETKDQKIERLERENAFLRRLAGLRPDEDVARLLETSMDIDENAPALASEATSQTGASGGNLQVPHQGQALGFNPALGPSSAVNPGVYGNYMPSEEVGTFAGQGQQPTVSNDRVENARASEIGQSFAITGVQDYPINQTTAADHPLALHQSVDTGAQQQSQQPGELPVIQASGGPPSAGMINSVSGSSQDAGRLLAQREAQRGVAAQRRANRLNRPDPIDLGDDAALFLDEDH